MKGKKLLALALCVSTAFVMLVATGCGGSSSTSSKSAASSASGSTKFEKQTWKFACSGGETSNWVGAAKQFAKEVGEKTDGAITVQYYPSDQLTNGSQTDGIQAVMDGTTDISMHSNLIYSSFDDRFSVVSLPFLFSSPEDADKVLGGDGGKALADLLDGFGLHLFGTAENGFRHVTSNKKLIKTPADMKGQKIRVAGSSVLMEAYKDWGANYTKANWSEVYTGLQTGTYDGQENPLPVADASSIADVSKYCTYWTGTYDCLFFVMNKDKYDSLDPELQKIVDEAGKNACEWQKKDNRSQDEKIMEKWEKKGVKFHKTTDAEMAEFKKLSDPVYSYYAKLLVKDGQKKEDVQKFLESFGVDDSLIKF